MSAEMTCSKCGSTQMEKGRLWAADAGRFKFKADSESVFASLFSARGLIRANACGNCGYLELYLEKND